MRGRPTWQRRKAPTHDDATASTTLVRAAEKASRREDAMSSGNELPRWLDLGVLPLFNLALALLVSGLVVLLIGLDPWQVMTLLVKGAFGSRIGFSYTLYYATTFVFTGLAVAVAFHGGLFNIGGEGQAMLGGIGTALVALALADYWPAWLVLPLMTLAAAVFGMA